MGFSDDQYDPVEPRRLPMDEVRRVYGLRLCPICNGSFPPDPGAERQKIQVARFRYYREREPLVAELTERGFVANVTLDGSVIITGRRP